LSLKAFTWFSRKSRRRSWCCDHLFDGGKRTKGMSLLECVVAASLLAILLSVVAANFLACQKVISRERLKRKGLLVAFKVTQNLMTIPFDRLPPEKFSGQEGTVKVKLSLPISGEVKAFKENGEDMPAYLEGDREVSVRVEGRSIFFVQYIASWNEGGW